MRFPSIQDVARELQLHNANTESIDGDEIDVRLQVHETGEWTVHAGDAQFDTDHRGYWGVGSVPGVYKGRVRRLNARALARELIAEAKEQRAILRTAVTRVTRKLADNRAAEAPKTAYEALAPMFHHCTGLATCGTCQAQAKRDAEKFLEAHIAVVHVGDKKGGA